MSIDKRKLMRMIERFGDLMHDAGAADGGSGDDAIIRKAEAQLDELGIELVKEEEA